MIPLPTQPSDVAWPTQEWPVAGDGDEVAALCALLDGTVGEDEPAETRETVALLVVHRGRIVAERYAAGVSAGDQQPSWSMAKSILHAAVGVLVRDGRHDVARPAGVAQWQGPGDARASITLDQMLHMTSGLRFVEDYVDERVSDVIRMLFRPGADDTGAFAASFPLDHPPDTAFNYSSGTSNIVSAIVAGAVGTGDAYLAFLRHELFDRIGMTSATPRFDNAGTWIGSSYCFCTPRDFARFGLLYLRDGVWDGERILPEGWVEHARTPAPVQPAEQDRGYGAHWWLLNDDVGTFFASGYAGQYLVLAPALDLIIVRNGNTPAERRPHVMALIRSIIDRFR